MVLVCPLRGTIRYKIGPLGEPQPAVALFIKDPALAGETQLNDVLMQFYRLTPAETRVATMLGAGCGMVGASRYLAVSENTVKTHAKRIYEKMGLKTPRRARSALRAASPFRPTPNDHVDARLTGGGPRSSSSAASSRTTCRNTPPP